MNQSHVDLDDWEILSDEQIGDDCDDEKVNKIMICSSTILKFQADYFTCPQFVDNNITSSPPSPPPPPSHSDFIQQDGGEDNPVSKKIINDHQKVSPKYRAAAMEVEEPWDVMIMSSPPSPIEFESSFPLDIMGNDYENQSSHREGAFNIWKWGVSAISSLGVAATALCIIIFSNNNKDFHHNQKLQFPIYSPQPQANNKGIHQASTIMAIRGGAYATRARIICRGYYKGTV